MNVLRTEPDHSALMPEMAAAGQLQVNEVLRRWPAALGPLNAFGIDTCCGGSDRLADAAHEGGVAMSDLWTAIVAATREVR
jgi:iron-sulfur cluster repair protein YtfE (RIC family)